MHNSHSAEEYERRHVGDSFHHYLATQQIISIMSAVTFLALITFVFDGRLENKYVVNVAFRADLFDCFIFMLTFAELCLVTAIVGFHATATEVYEEWGIFFPARNTRRRIASLSLTCGVYSVQLALGLALLMSGHWASAALNIPALLAWPYFISRITEHRRKSRARENDAK
ncbi:MAG: hypothetical protein HY243_16840 [Proteobacteria bacterium]|nr:hypothetical protein [Pseudomonadota bacterium]